MMKIKNQGITLVALVITVIVLIILAGVTLSTLVGDNGIITKAIEAKQNMENASREEEELLQNLLDEIEEIEGEENNEELLPPDEGKEELILEYTVEEGDTIELPYSLIYIIDKIGGENGPTEMKAATYMFDVDWGDGFKEEGINNENIKEKAIHTYSNAGKYDIKIKGIFESMINSNIQEGEDNIPKKGKDKLTKIKQWGVTGLKTIQLKESLGLVEIGQPTKSSFKDLEFVAYGFVQCTSLKKIPEGLFANCDKLDMLSYIFSGCPLNMAPKNLFANCVNVQECTGIFYMNKELKEIGEGIFKNCKNIRYLNYTFMDCDSITSIPNDLFKDCINVEMLCETFYLCDGITDVPEGLFDNCINLKICEGTFFMCNGLTIIPENIFEKCNEVTHFVAVFADCPNLTGKAPELWLRVQDGEKNGFKGIPDGEGCFKGCTKLDNYSDIPNYWCGE